MKESTRAAQSGPSRRSSPRSPRDPLHDPKHTAVTDLELLEATATAVVVVVRRAGARGASASAPTEAPTSSPDTASSQDGAFQRSRARAYRPRAPSLRSDVRHRMPQPMTLTRTAEVYRTVAGRGCRIPLARPRARTAERLLTCAHRAISKHVCDSRFCGKAAVSPTERRRPLFVSCSPPNGFAASSLTRVVGSPERRTARAKPRSTALLTPHRREHG